MSRLDWYVANRGTVTEQDLLKLREELLEMKKRGEKFDPYERTACRCLEKLPIKVEEFKLLLELGF